MTFVASGWSKGLGLTALALVLLTCGLPARADDLADIRALYPERSYWLDVQVLADGWALAVYNLRSGDGEGSALLRRIDGRWRIASVARGDPIDRERPAVRDCPPG